MKIHLLPLVLVALAACHKEEAPAGKPKQALAQVPASLALAKAPASPLSVLEMRSGSADGAEVVVTGRAKDFVDGRATFSIADLSLKSCADAGDVMVDKCPTPWDYCCVDVKAKTEGTATIQVQDGAEVAKGSLQGWNGLDHLVPVVVHGKLKKDDMGNLTVIADGIFVQS